MANSTHFYSHYDRTVKRSISGPEDITDTFQPDFLVQSIGFEIGHHFIVDFGVERKTTHLFLKQSNMRTANIRGANTITDITSGTAAVEVLTTTPADDGKRQIHTLQTPLSNHRYVAITPASLESGQSNAKLDVVIFMESLADYPDGAFSEYVPSWEHRTQGHHLLISGRKVRFPGLGMPKRKLQLASEYLPYDYTEDIENAEGKSMLLNSIMTANQIVLVQNADTRVEGNVFIQTTGSDKGKVWKWTTATQIHQWRLQGNLLTELNLPSSTNIHVGNTFVTVTNGDIWIPSSNVVQGDITYQGGNVFLGDGNKWKVQIVSPPVLDGHVLGEEDVKKLEDIFLNHLHFVVADSLDRHPERIFVASFEDTEFGLPFSSTWKEQGHNIDVVVCEV